MPETETPPAPEKLEPHRNGETHEGHEALITARLGIWLFLGALTMFFGALAVVWVLAHGERLNYPFVAPNSLWLSTIAILASSATYVLAVRSIRSDDQRGLTLWLGLTLLLGAVFVVGQVYSWSQVAETIASQSKSPLRTWFYILTGLHAAHVLGGLAWVSFVFVKSRHGVYIARKHVGVELGAAYWHFMDAVWVVFFVLVMFL